MPTTAKHLLPLCLLLALTACSDPTGDFPPAAPSATALAEVAEVTGILIELMELSAEEIDPDTPLAEYGVDDLTLVELVMAVEEDCGVVISDEELLGAVGASDYTDSLSKLTVQRLAELIAAKRKE
jgi:acyl carrier protein